MRQRLRWLTPLVALCAVTASVSVPPAVAAPAPPRPTVTDTSRLAAPDGVLPAGWRTSTDRAVTTSGDDNGFNVLVADASSGYQWRTAATLSESGFDTDQWIGQACVTGSGDRAVVTYAPRAFTNDETAFDDGAFAAIVDLRTGAVHKLPVRVSLAYYDPGCGTAETATLSALSGSTTTVDVVDATTAEVTRSIRATGQLTSVVPYAGSVAAALGDRVVSVDATGAERTLTTESGVPFRLSVDSVGGLAYQVPAGQQVQVRRLAAGRSTLLGTGALGAVRVVGTAGHAYLVGPDAPRIPLTAAHGGLRMLAAPVTGEPSSTGALVVTTSTEQAVPTVPTVPQVRISATVTGTAKPVSFAVTPHALQPAQGSAPSPVLAAGSAPASTRAAAVDPGTVPWDPDRGCAVPRNDPTIQTYQATAKQVEWAADLAVQGQLTVTRPANWMGSGMPVSWTPQGMFPLRQLAGGGRVPAQVLLGVLAQESNTMQASPHAVDSITGNVNQGGFYGNGTSWSTVDCGYGVGQVTTGMATNTPAGTPVADGNMAYTTAEQQQAIATDYASNIAASLNMLIDKWNALKAAGIIADNGDPSQIENWYLALWAYNSGIQPDAGHGNTTGCTPGPNCTDGFGDWGLGWFNNPANPRLAADRKVFNDSAADTKVPNDWTYPELVIGWSASPVIRYDYTTHEWGPSYAAGYWGQSGPVSVAPESTFCGPSNQCTPGGALDSKGVKAAGLCSAHNSDCWWHVASTWIDCTTKPCGAQILTYAAGSAEPDGTDPYPPDCNAGALPSNAVIVDDVTTSSVAPCNKTWTNGGSFALRFGKSNFANCTTNCVLYQGKIDFHQLGVGFGGHIWFTHAVATPVENLGTFIDDTVTGTWTPPASTTGWTRIKVHVPDNGATTAQADYVINWGNGQTRHRLVNQHWNKNTWVDLGTFDLSAGASVSLSNLNPRVPVADIDGGDIAYDAMAFIPSVQPIIDYVAIGDSYSSGQGLQPYDGDSDNNTDGCHRSPEAYPYQLEYPGASQTVQQEAAGNGAADFAFLACSGATTVQTTAAAVGTPTAVNTPWSDQDSYDSHEPYQIEDSGYLDQDTTLVTLSVGGDDARFASVLKSCFETVGECANGTYVLNINGTADPQPLTVYEPEVLGWLQPHLESLYREIHAVAPNARIVVLGYPHLVSDGAGNIACAGFLAPDVAWLNQMGDQIDTVTGNAVSDVAKSGVDIQFVDPRAEFQGHDACQPAINAWINSVIAESSSGSGTTVPGVGSFHPTLLGQAAYAFLINGILSSLQE